MPTKRCCCNRNCEIGRDNFDRPDEDPVTGNWQEISGDWEINGNELNSLSDGPLITTLRQPPPVREGNGYNTRIVVDLVIPDSGDRTYGIITAYRGTGDYSWIKLEYSATTGELLPTFYNSPTNVVMDTTTHPGTEVHSASPGTNVTVQICCSNVEWTFSISEVQWASCDGGGLDELPPAPLGGVGFLMGRFDNWEYHIHWESKADCDTCICFCANPDDVEDYKCVPDCLMLTVTQDGTGEYNCGCLDGLSLVLTKAFVDVGPPIVLLDTAKPKSWYSEVFECESVRYWFILTCVAPEIFSLSLVVEGDVDPEAQGPQLLVDPLTPPTSTQCNPIIIEYDGAISAALVTCNIGDPPTGTGQRVVGCTECYEGSVPDIRWSVTVTECA